MGFAFFGLGQALGNRITCMSHENDSRSILLSSIKVADRDSGQLFFNPRHSDAFSREFLSDLYNSIRIDGLLESPVVREYEDGYQLIAGERRYRTICNLVKDDVPCYSRSLPRPKKWNNGAVVIHHSQLACFVEYIDSQNCEIQYYDDNEKLGDFVTVPVAELRPTAPASKVYHTLRCTVIPDCDDDWAIRIAMAENQNQMPLTMAEEIALCERLEKLGKKQQEICRLVGRDATWVCHTLNFRKQLPQEAFDCLIENKMVRNVAVQFFKYPEEFRANLLKMAESLASKEKASMCQEIQEELNELQDLEELHADMAVNAPDSQTAKFHAKKSKSAASASKKTRKKKEHLEESQGCIQQGHIENAAAELGLKPKTPKCLSRKDIEKFYVTGINKILKNSKSGKIFDPVFEEEIQPLYLAVAQGVAQGILDGDRDPLLVLRNIFMDQGVWKTVEVGIEEEDTDSEVDETNFEADDCDDDDIYNEFDPDAYEDDDDYDNLNAILGQED